MPTEMETNSLQRYQLEMVAETCGYQVSEDDTDEDLRLVISLATHERVHYQASEGGKGVKTLSVE